MVYWEICYAPAIFDCFMRPLCSWSTHPSIFNLLWQEMSSGKSGLLWVVSYSSDDMAQNIAWGSKRAKRSFSAIPALNISSYMAWVSSSGFFKISHTIPKIAAITTIVTIPTVAPGTCHESLPMLSMARCGNRPWSQCQSCGVLLFALSAY